MAPTQYLDSAYSIDITHNAANIYENYTGQVFAVNLAGIDGIENAYRADGGDVVATQEDGTRIRAAKPSFTRSASSGTMLIRFPSGDAVGGGQKIYLQWGGSSVNVADDADVFPSDHVLASIYDGTGKDFSQSDNDGTLGGTTGTPTLATGVIGDGLDFDHTDSQYVEYGDEDYYSFPSKAFTVCAWVKISSTGDDQNLISKYVGAGGREYMCQAATFSRDPRILCYDLSNAASITKQADNDIADATWVMLTFAKGSGETNAALNLYGNNALLAATTVDFGAYVAMENGTAPMRLGLNGNDNFPFGGVMNAVRLLSETEWSLNRIKTQYDAESTFATNGAFTIGNVESYITQSNYGTGIGAGIGLPFGGN